MIVADQEYRFDYVFAGAGASATLLLMSMEQGGLFEGKKVLILDPDAKATNDKTYCYWSTPDEIPNVNNTQLISHQWERVSVNQQAPELIFPLSYHHISSSDLYKELYRIIERYNIQRQQAKVLSIETVENGALVSTDQGLFLAHYVFDSRPPVYLPLKKNQVHLLQSFKGFVIQTATELPNADGVRLMDFEIDQQGNTQFVYVLPLGTHKALVELTRFGIEAITHSEADPLLKNYIQQRFGNYEIVDIETGCIPMSTATISNTASAHVIPIGGRAGAIKPSTGYAFKNMARHAEAIAHSIQENKEIPKISSPARFYFYDRLLLLILSRLPFLGKPIFEALFKRNSIHNVLLFLDERTTLFQELRILLSLPIMPFLKVWSLDASVQYRYLFRPILLVMVALVLCLLHAQVPFIYPWVEVSLLVLGLVLVGIPHGALDHLLEYNQLNAPPKLGFIMKYLGVALAYGVIWLLSPYLALFFFLIYSIWHFGESDMIEWQSHSPHPIKNWLWGIILFGVLLAGHPTETNVILTNMGVNATVFNPEYGETVAIILFAIASIWACIASIPGMLLSVLMLLIGTQLPLISAFGLYFIGQHSLHGWAHLKRGLHTQSFPLFLKSAPFTLAALLLFVVLIFALKTGILQAFQQHYLTAFFVFISCISLPHVLAMHGYYKKYFNEISGH